MSVRETTERWAAGGAILALALLLVGSAVPARAQEAGGTESVEEAAKQKRKAAGLRAGTWLVTDLPEPDGASISTRPAFRGYFQNGLDLHLAVENSIGYWGRTVEESNGTTRVHLIPQFTSLKVYPTRPEAPVQPYLGAGAGFAIGVEDVEGSGGLAGFLGGSGTRMVPGFGLRGTAGLEFPLGSAFGLAVEGEYRWMDFFNDDLGGKESYGGFGLGAGLVYRFQYR